MNRIRGIRVTLLGVVLSMHGVHAGPGPAAESWTYEPYHKNRDQFVLDIPVGWHAADQAPYGDSGVVAFIRSRSSCARSKIRSFRRSCTRS